MNTKRTYFRRTTPQQRRLLFEVWEATKDVEKACRQAHVGKSTFYYWKPRFEAGGYAALESFQSFAPKEPRQTPPEVVQQVIELRHQNPRLGKRSIADRLTQANGGVPVVSPNTVRRILQDAGLWETETETAEAPPPPSPPVVRYAERPGQTVNVDLAFLPATHEAQAQLPAVSGSSGRLVIKRPREEQREASWPGRIFENPDLGYAEAMQGFVAASQEGHSERSTATRAQPSEPVTEGSDRADPEAERRALRRQEAQLREERREIRERRRQEDAAWQALRAERKAQGQADPAPSDAGTSRSSGTPPDRDEEWRALRRQRRETLAKRREEDALWRQQRQALRQALAALPVVTAWVVVLVVIDNCTRQCLGLPLFVVGPKVTAEMVVEALRLLLPADLQFLISDRGVHFTAQAFEQLMQELHILHVFIARHRPQSNGIAERFVRTLKEWLADKSWQSPEELMALLEEFLEWYNQRPHQGLPRPGISPNEYAHQLRQALLTGSPPNPTPS